MPITFNGFDDIFWGKSGDADADDVHNEYAYSAMYYRKHIKDKTESNSIIPKMTFKHVMTCLEFSVLAMDGAAEALTISSIELVDAPKDIKLIVADKEDESQEGKVIVEDDSDSIDVALRDVSKPEYDAKPLSQTSITSTETVIGGADGYPAAFYVLPQKNHKIRVSMLKGGTVFSYEKDVSLPDFDSQNGQTTYAGYKYKLKLQIYGPQQISLKATLKDWEYTEGENDIPIEL